MKLHLKWSVISSVLPPRVMLLFTYYACTWERGKGKGHFPLQPLTHNPATPTPLVPRDKNGVVADKERTYDVALLWSITPSFPACMRPLGGVAAGK